MVVGIGEALWDILPDGKKIGGAPANFAYHVSQFGFDSCVVSAVGRDQAGDELKERLKERGLVSFLPTVDYPTGTIAVTLDEAGIPAYDIKENVAWDNIPWSPELGAIALRTRAVSFGSLAQRSAVSRNTIHRFLDTMPHGAGTYRVFDINLRQDFYSAEIVTESIHRCNVLKINDEELLEIGRMFGESVNDVTDCCRRLLKRFDLQILILTCGVVGSYVFTPEAVSFVETPRVTVADTVGAGDSFTATFIAAVLHGLPVEAAHRLAVEASAYVCTCHGAMPRFPEAIIEKFRK